MFRGEDGGARVLDAYCPHLGAHLGVGGKVVGNDDPVSLPRLALGRLGRVHRRARTRRRSPRYARIGTWPAREQNGYVMVWHHAEGKPPDFDMPAIPEASDPAYYKYKRVRWELATHIQEMYENARRHPALRARARRWQIEKVNWDGDGPDRRRSMLDLKRDAAVQSNAEGETVVPLVHVRAGPVADPGHRQDGRRLDPDADAASTTRSARSCTRYYAKKSEPASRPSWRASSTSTRATGSSTSSCGTRRSTAPQPLLAENDGDVGRFRRWYKQFYSTDLGIDRF